MSISTIITLIIWIALFIFFVVSKKHFTHPDESLSKGAKLFLIITTILVVGGNLSYLGFAYYKAYNPDYEYDKVSKLVDYHVYRPTALPDGYGQISKFYKNTKAVVGSNITITSVYEVSLSEVVKGDAKSVILNQTRVEPDFDLYAYIQSKITDSEEVNIEQVSLSNFPDQPIYQSGGVVKYVYLITQDNVLIVIGSPKETQENLLLIANSLK